MKNVVARSPYLTIVAVGSGLAILILSAFLISDATTALPDTVDAAVPASEEVLVPEGQFLMGCAPDIWSGCDSDSQPIHAVYLDAFYIDKTEVTVSQYYDCVAAGGCPLPEVPGASATSLDALAFDNNPVTYVTWLHSDAYCRWLGKRLPTEAEWEKAAHGPNWQIYPWGNEPPTCDRLNYDRCIGGVVPVGSYPQNASPYGALDMAGNVREWVNDFYLKAYYARSPYYNPQGPEPEDTKGEHLLRGGSWKDDYGITTWVRLDEAETYYIYKAGFRCARPAPSSATPTPSPTATPFAAQTVTDRGGAVWLPKPDHLTLVQVPAGSLSYTTALTLTYAEAAVSDPLSGIGHTFRVQALSAAPENPALPGALEKPVEIAVAFPEHLHTISGTLELYRLDHGAWITEGITGTHWGSNYMNAYVRYPGVYAVLGRTNRLFLPLVVR